MKLMKRPGNFELEHSSTSRARVRTKTAKDSWAAFGAPFIHFEDQTDGPSQSPPALAFGFESRPPFPCQAIELGLTPGLGLPPLARQQAAVFKPLQRRVERALRNLNYAMRYLLEALRDRIPVNRTGRDNFQDQQVQRALVEIRFRELHRHLPPSSTYYTNRCRSTRYNYGNRP